MIENKTSDIILLLDPYHYIVILTFYAYTS